VKGVLPGGSGLTGAGAIAYRSTGFDICYLLFAICYFRLAYEGELVPGSTGAKKKHNASVYNFGGF